MGMLGYMRFGSIVEDNILLNYINLNWTNTVLFNTCRVAMVMCLVVSYPLILFPCRMCLPLLKDALRAPNTSAVRSISNGNVSYNWECVYNVVLCSADKDGFWPNGGRHWMPYGLHTPPTLLLEN